jgi:hypothetical protein
MSHKNAYEYFLECGDEVLYPFADSDTWEYIYNTYVPRTIEIMASLSRRAAKGEESSR